MQANRSSKSAEDRSTLGRTKKVEGLRRDPLWAALLTHYNEDGQVDLRRMQAQIDSLVSDVRQFLIAGSTGDGWEIGDEQLRTLASLQVPAGCRLAFGALRTTTERVIQAASIFASRARDQAVVAVTVCPPVNEHITQRLLVQHFLDISESVEVPIAIYELPQVTRCSIDEVTMRTLADDARFVMFKDTSGIDAIAASGAADQLVRLRGAEGRYSQARAPQGAYDGWLLSSANAIPTILRSIAQMLSVGEVKAADTASVKAERVVGRLFELAKGIPFGNAFSNANRAADHIRAHGDSALTTALPRTSSGAKLPAYLIEGALELFRAEGLVPQRGYLVD
jgi:4-hydroxy-tetrahydrodipicolinate synthase